MKHIFVLLFILHIAVIGCHRVYTHELPETTQEPSVLTPLKTTVCELKEYPEKFDKKFVQLTGFVSRGFEDSYLFAPECDSSHSIWVETGGKTGSGVIYCCNVPPEREREKELVVDGKDLSLLTDDNFKKFDEALQENGNSVVRADVIGTFFAGEKIEGNGKVSWGGYGHFGMSSLFVIQQVMKVELEGRGQFDTVSSIGFDDEDCDAYSHMWDPNEKQDLENQKLANKGNAGWMIDDPQKVATEGLLSLLNSKKKQVPKLKEIKSGKGTITYRWNPGGSEDGRYLVIVSRPYWLSFYAAHPDKVIWTIREIIHLCD